MEWGGRGWDGVVGVMGGVGGRGFHYYRETACLSSHFHQAEGATPQEIHNIELTPLFPWQGQKQSHKLTVGPIKAVEKTTPGAVKRSSRDPPPSPRGAMQSLAGTRMVQSSPGPSPAVQGLG